MEISALSFFYALAGVNLVSLPVVRAAFASASAGGGGVSVSTGGGGAFASAGGGGGAFASSGGGGGVFASPGGGAFAIPGGGAFASTGGGAFASSGGGAFASTDGDTFTSVGGSQDVFPGSQGVFVHTNNPHPSRPCMPQFGKFQCSNGACVNEDVICDGTRHCRDGSDETYDLCRHVRCERGSFQCAYKACVDWNARCNGLMECADGSDEKGCDDDGNDEERYSPPTPRPTSPLITDSREGCRLPDHPQNTYSVFNCSSCHPGPKQQVGSGQLVLVSCKPGYELASHLKTFSECKHGKWSEQIPKCYKLCRALSSLTLDLKCWQGSTSVSCGQKMPPNTTVQYQCREFHQFTRNTGLPTWPKCQENGAWSRELPTCEPSCGLSNLNTGITFTPAIMHGQASQTGNFPWHAGLFQKSNDVWTNVCGGSLITPRAVLTAAHCVATPCYGCKSESLFPSEVMVALGKTHRDWNVQEPQEIKRAVEKIHVHETYAGSSFNFDHDIAVLTLKSAVPVNEAVMPVCLDMGNVHDSAITTGITGFVSGWGNTVDCVRGDICNPSESLRYTNTTVIDFDTCFNITQKLKRLPISRLTQDKICSGNGSEAVVQQGDSGGGLVFPFEGKYFVYGIVSVKDKIENVYNFGAFTRVSTYLDWIIPSIS